MVYNILSNMKVINTIVSDEDFVSTYCQENGYAYELVEAGTTPKPAEEPVTWASMAAAIKEGVNSID